MNLNQHIFHSYYFKFNIVQPAAYILADSLYVVIRILLKPKKQI